MNPLKCEYVINLLTWSERGQSDSQNHLYSQNNNNIFIQETTELLLQTPNHPPPTIVTENGSKDHHFEDKQESVQNGDLKNGMVTGLYHTVLKGKNDNFQESQSTLQVSAGNTPKLTNSNGSLSKLTNRSGCNNGSTGKLAPNSACNSTANLTNNNVEGEMSSECSQQTGMDDDIQNLDRIKITRMINNFCCFLSSENFIENKTSQFQCSNIEKNH